MKSDYFAIAKICLRELFDHIYALWNSPMAFFGSILALSIAATDVTIVLIEA